MMKISEKDNLDGFEAKGRIIKIHKTKNINHLIITISN